MFGNRSAEGERAGPIATVTRTCQLQQVLGLQRFSPIVVVNRWRHSSRSASPPELLPRKRVYPRVCGGTAGRCRCARPQTRGLSPRVRGNHAGGFVGRPQGMTRVYPRVCGGTTQRHQEARCDIGSIPACAGEPASTTGLPAGSIPACAGEPAEASVSHDLLSQRVYPRVCGGTLGRRLRRPLIPACAGEPVPRISGLSPRVRGNLGGTTRQLVSASSRVYPRVCGGTTQSRPSSGLILGLSPRVRGNLPRRRRR